jgi:hypothetical protein
MSELQPEVREQGEGGTSPFETISTNDSDSAAPTTSRTLVARALGLRESRFAWPIAYGGVFVAQAVVLLVAGRNQWYFFDEWRLIVERVVQPGDVTNFERLFRPDGEHVIALPLALFIVLAKVGGLDSYWPFIIANVVVRLATLWAADDIVRRFGGRRAARFMVMVSIAFFGDGFESLFGQSLIFAGLTLLFCLLALREAVRDDVSIARSGAMATGFLVAAVFSTSYAFPMVLGVALYFALSRRPMAAVGALVVPPAVFVIVRALAGGSYSEQQEISPRFVGLYVDYVQAGLTAVGEGVTGLVGLGLAAFAAIVVASVLLAERRGTTALVAAITLAVVAFYGQASLSRSALGAGQASSSRYVFFCGVLLFVMLGAAWAARRVTPKQAGVVGILLIISLGNSLGRLVDGYDFFVSKMSLSHDRLSVGFVAHDDWPDLVPDPDWAPDLRYERLDGVIAWSGSAEFLAEGRACFDAWTRELTSVEADASSISDRERAALVVLLNEHSLGYGAADLSFGELVQFAAAGETGSGVLSQFTDVYASLGAELTDSPAVPDLTRCG